MSGLMGLGKGLAAAGQSISQGLFAYAMMLREDERERMRNDSMERRWAREDQIRADAEAKADKRYQEERDYRKERDEATDKRYSDEGRRRDAREGRMEEKQDIGLLNQSLDRLKEIRNEKAKLIEQQFIDPMTKQVMDPEGYRAAMAELDAAYRASAADQVQKSGMSQQQLDKYGFSAFLSKPAAAPAAAPVTDMAPVTPAPEAPKAFDRAAWAGGLDPAQPLTADQMKMLTPEEQRQRIQQRQLLQQSGGLMAQPQGESIMDKLGRVW